MTLGKSPTIPSEPISAHDKDLAIVSMYLLHVVYGYTMVHTFPIFISMHLVYTYINVCSAF